MTEVSERDVVVHNLALEGALREMLTCLEARGVPALVLKGVPLLRRLPRGLRTRLAIDNDLLVRRADVLTAYRALLDLGYLPHPHLRIESQLEASSEYALFHPSGAIVDLHWNAFPPHLFFVPEEIQWSRSTVIEVGGTRARVFDAPLTLLHLAAHFVQHGLSETRILKELSSLWELWQHELDARELAEVARATGTLSALAYCARAARELGWLQAKVPEELTQDRRAALLERWVPPSSLEAPRPSSDYVRAVQSLLLADPRCLPTWLRRHFTPPLDNLAAVYDEPASATLRVRYFTRLFRPLAKRFGRLR